MRKDMEQNTGRNPEQTTWMDREIRMRRDAEQDLQENARESMQDAAGEAVQRGWKYYLGYYALYAVIFCLMAAAVFVWFWLGKRRFVWATDGVNQHYYGLLYFSRWGKEVLRQFRETQVLRIPTFTLRMGYGEDLYTTLAYYVIGDPFSLPAVFVPEQYLLLFHDLMLMVRFFLAGITFSAYSFYMGKRSRAGVLAGALVYVFNGFTLSGMRHHYFLNPFIFFPLLLIGCERIFRKKKPGLFIFMVFLSAVSNFYFFYMMVLMTVLYAVWRSLRLRGLRQFGRVLLDGLSFLWYGLLGTLLSSFLFLPVVLRFLQDPRTADEKQIPLLWPLKYYQNFLDSFLSNSSSALAESWTYMGFGAVAVFCVLFIFVQWKKHLDQKAAFLGLTALLLTPAAGYVLNGFSYPANRWMWAYALLIGTMTASAVAEIPEAGAGTFLKALVLLGAVIAVCVGWHYTFSREAALDVIIALFGAAVVLLGRVAMLEKEQQVSGGEPEQLPGNRNAGGAAAAADAPADAAGIRIGRKNPGAGRYALRVQAALLACVMVTIAAAGYFSFSPSAGGGIFEYLSRAQIDLLVSRDAAAASSLIDGNLLKAADGAQTPFYRYTTFNPENNTSILYGVSNTQYYWSLSNPDVSQFMNETGQLGSMIHQYDTLDDRTMLNEVAGIRYFLSDSPEGIPFGYEKAEGLSYSNGDLWPENDSADRYSCEVYENRYALPFGFTSDKWISREDYDALDIPQRQQALMQGIVLEQDPGEAFTELSAAGAGAVQAAGAQAAGNQAAQGNAQAVFSDQRMPAQITYDTEKITEADLSADDGTPLRFEAAEGGGTVTFRFEGLADCETALYIRGLQYTPPAGRQGAKKLLMTTEGFSGEAKLVSKQIGYTTQRDPWATGRTDFLVNMRYRTEALDQIRLTLPAPGTYTFESIEVVCQPMQDYPAQAEALRAQTLTGLDIHEQGNSGATGRITGRISVDAPRILCLQIPKTAGWTAYVDGEKTELLQADTMFSALPLTAGTHEIELRYQTPGLRLGAVISLGTLLLIIAFFIVYAIVSAVLRARERRADAIPVGEYESVSGETVGEEDPADGISRVGGAEPAPADGISGAGGAEPAPADGISGAGGAEPAPADGISGAGGAEPAPADGISSGINQD